MNQKPQSHNTNRPSGWSVATCAGSARKPAVTRPSKTHKGLSYVARKSQTNSGILHQFRTLKATAVDTAQVRSETGGGRGVSPKLAGNMVEVSGAAQATPVTSIPQGHGEIGTYVPNTLPASRAGLISTQSMLRGYRATLTSAIPPHGLKAAGFLASF